MRLRLLPCKLNCELFLFAANLTAFYKWKTKLLVYRLLCRSLYLQSARSPWTASSSRSPWTLFIWFFFHVCSHLTHALTFTKDFSNSHRCWFLWCDLLNVSAQASNASSIRTQRIHAFHCFAVFEVWINGFAKSRLPEIFTKSQSIL